LSAFVQANLHSNDACQRKILTVFSYFLKIKKTRFCVKTNGIAIVANGGGCFYGRVGFDFNDFIR